jgi:hypothetical protein
VNVASISGCGAKLIAAYCAAKHAVVGFTRGGRGGLRLGVTVNAVCPGYVDTPLTDHTLERIGERTKRTRAESLETLLRTPASRLVTADEVATTVLSLCGEAAPPSPDKPSSSMRGVTSRFRGHQPRGVGPPERLESRVVGPDERPGAVRGRPDGADATGASAARPFPEQWDRALARVIAVVHAAGGAPEHVGRLTGA